MKPSLSSSEVRALFHERLDALLPDCDKVMDSAGYGRTLHDLDDFLFIAGKGFLNEVLKEKLQERIESVEATPASKECPACKKNAHARPICPHRSNRQQSVTLRRRYRCCSFAKREQGASATPEEYETREVPKEWAA